MREQSTVQRRPAYAPLTTRVGLNTTNILLTHCTLPVGPNAEIALNIFCTYWYLCVPVSLLLSPHDKTAVFFLQQPCLLHSSYLTFKYLHSLHMPTLARTHTTASYEDEDVRLRSGLVSTATVHNNATTCLTMRSLYEESGNNINILKPARLSRFFALLFPHHSRLHPCFHHTQIEGKT